MDEIAKWHEGQAEADQAICDRLREIIDDALPEAESKIWHAHPVWFLDGNPIVGYSKLKTCVRLMFWSGQSFSAPGLVASGTFKAADARYTSVEEIDEEALREWLAENNQKGLDDLSMHAQMLRKQQAKEKEVSVIMSNVVVVYRFVACCTWNE